MTQYLTLAAYARRLEAVLPGDKRTELRLHRALAADALGGEWFRPRGILAAIERLGGRRAARKVPSGAPGPTGPTFGDVLGAALEFDAEELLAELAGHTMDDHETAEEARRA